jgi:hypothetical protein
MSDNTAWWSRLSGEELEAELAEDARQDRLAEEAYREFLERPQIVGTEDF